MKLVTSILMLVMTPAAWANDGGTTAQFLFAKEAETESQVKAQFGFGMLDGTNLGKDGVAFTNYFGFGFNVADGFLLSIGLPLAGTLSNGPDNYGIGNITVGLKYVGGSDDLKLGAGVDVAAGTAQSNAAIGAASRMVTHFVKDQTAISPYFLLSWVRDRLSLTLDAGADLQVFSSAPAGESKFETLLSYDGALGYSFYENIWVTLEAGGYSMITYNTVESPIFVGPGIRFQDHEMSAGFHFYAPLGGPPKDAVNFAGLVDFRIAF